MPQHVEHDPRVQRILASLSPSQQGGAFEIPLPGFLDRALERLDVIDDRAAEGALRRFLRAPGSRDEATDPRVEAALAKAREADEAFDRQLEENLRRAREPPEREPRRAGIAAGLTAGGVPAGIARRVAGPVERTTAAFDPRQLGAGLIEGALRTTEQLGKVGAGLAALGVAGARSPAGVAEVPRVVRAAAPVVAEPFERAEEQLRELVPAEEGLAVLPRELAAALPEFVVAERAAVGAIPKLARFGRVGGAGRKIAERAARDAAIGVPFSVLSGEAVEDPTALLTTPAAFAALGLGFGTAGELARAGRGRLAEALRRRRQAAGAAVQSEAGIPADLRAASEAGGATITSRTVAPGVQREPSQVSERAVSPSETTRPISPPPRLEGASTVREGIVPPELLGQPHPSRPTVIIAQPATEINELVARAEARLPIYQADLETALQDVPGVQLVGVRAKALESVQRKVRDQARPPEAVQDYLGGRVSSETLEAGEAVLERLRARGYRVLEDENFTAQPKAGYRARHVNLLAPDGELSVELQIVPKELAEVQDEAWKLYDVLRRPEVSEAERLGAKDQVERIFNGAWEKFERRNGTQPMASRVEGQATEVVTPVGSYRTRYAVVEAEEVIPSHRPEAGFSIEPRYPQGVQERQYHRDVAEQAKVVRNAQQFDPRFVITDNPDAINGPPIVTANGVVLGGNSRAMTMQLLYARGRGQEAVKARLVEQAPRFGLEADVVAGMNRPMLVRIVDAPTNMTSREMAELVRQFNEPLTQQLSTAAASVAQAKRVSPQTLDFVGRAMQEGETLNAFLSRSGPPAAEMIRLLQADGVITAQNVSQLVARGQFTREGRQAVERVLRGVAVPDATVLETAPAGWIQKVDRSIPAIASAKAVPGYDLQEPLLEALEIGARMRSTGETLDDVVAQLGIFGGEGASRQALALARLLEEAKPTEVRDAFARYAQRARAGEASARGQTELLGVAEPPLPPAQAFEEAFGRFQVAGAEVGASDPRVVAALARAGVGAAAGAAVSPEDRAGGALVGAALLGLGPSARRALRRLGQAGGVGRRASIKDLRAIVEGRQRTLVGGGPREGLALGRERLQFVVPQLRRIAGDELGTGAGEVGAARTPRQREIQELLFQAERDLAAVEGRAASVQLFETKLGRLRGETKEIPVAPGQRSLFDVLKDERGQLDLFPEASGATKGKGPLAIDPEEFANLAKFALDPTGEQVLRREVEKAVRKRGLAPKQRVPWIETRRVALELGLSPEDLLKPQAVRLTGAELLAIRNIVKGNIERLGRVWKRLETDAGLTAAERERMSTIAASLEAQNDALLGRFAVAGSAKGRDLNSLKMLAKDNMDPIVWFARAKRQLGTLPFTEEHRTRIVQLVNAGDRVGLARYVANLREFPWQEKLTTLWKAILLGAFRTHEVNVASNTAFGMLEAAKDLPAWGFDVLLRPITGVATKSPSMQGLLGASLKGARKGIAEARGVMKGRGVDAALRRYDQYREVDFKNPIADGYTKFIFRALVAGDRPFRLAAQERSLHEQARLLARREGFKGETFRRRVSELLDEPTDEMALRAIAASEYAIFVNRGVLSSLAAGMKKGARQRGPGAAATVEFIMPFTQVPANIPARVAEFSPLGLITTPHQAARLMRLVYKQRRGEVPITEVEQAQLELVERLGRVATGAGAPILAGFALYMSGRMTGLAESPAERAQWNLEGKPEMAVQLGDRWWHVGRLAPAGNLMVVGAEIARAMEQGVTPGQVAARGAGAIGTSVFEQPFLTGLRTAIESFRDPARGLREFSLSFARSWVPNAIAQFAPVFDPTLRVTETELEQVLARIPGASRRLEPRRDTFGRVIERFRSPAEALAAVFDPFYSRRDRTKDDPLIAEMDRIDIVLPRRAKLSGEGFADFNRRLGQEGLLLHEVLTELIQTRDYQDVAELAQDLAQDRGSPFFGQAPEKVAKEIQRMLILRTTDAVRTQLSMQRIAVEREKVAAVP